MSYVERKSSKLSTRSYTRTIHRKSSSWREECRVDMEPRHRKRADTGTVVLGMRYRTILARTWIPWGVQVYIYIHAWDSHKHYIRDNTL